MNTIEEASKSKADSEWIGGISIYSKNAFIANCNTPRSDSSIYNYNLAKNYLFLLSKGKISLGELSFSKSNNSLNPEQNTRLELEDLLSVELLGAVHSVLTLIPKSTKMMVLDRMLGLVRKERNGEIVTRLISLVKEALKFYSCVKHIGQAEQWGGRMSAAGSSHRPDGLIYSLYKNVPKNVGQLSL